MSNVLIDVAFPFGYVLPFLVFPLFGARLLQRWGWVALAGLFVVCVALAAIIMASAGGAYRSLDGTGGFEFSGLGVAAFTIAYLLLPGLAALVIVRGLGKPLKRQVIIPLLVCLLVGAASFPIFALTVGCTLTGECI